MIMKKLYLLLSIFFASLNAFASDVVDVLPLTKNIVVVHFKDGYVIHHKKGQQRTDESVVTDPLNVGAASLVASYTIISSNDPAYAAAINPSSVGRKSKGTDYALLCDTYYNGVGCVNNGPDYTSEHWLYLYLPSAMVSGKSYTITLNSLAKNNNTFTFNYDEQGCIRKLSMSTI